MKVVIQRVKEAKVEVENKVVGKIEKGFLVFLGITHTDTKEQADYLVKKLCNLRVFTDREGKMNLGLKEVLGELLIVSQFTLYADTKKGRRPSYVNALKSNEAIKLYDLFNEKLSKYLQVSTGVFGEDMEVESINDGPVTIILERE